MRASRISLSCYFTFVYRLKNPVVQLCDSLFSAMPTPKAGVDTGNLADVDGHSTGNAPLFLRLYSILATQR